MSKELRTCYDCCREHIILMVGILTSRYMPSKLLLGSLNGVAIVLVLSTQHVYNTILLPLSNTNCQDLSIMAFASINNGEQEMCASQNTAVYINYQTV